MAQQSNTGFGVANPVPYSPEEKPDTLPSDKQPPGVDEESKEVDYNSLEEALTGG